MSKFGTVAGGVVFLRRVAKAFSLLLLILLPALFLGAWLTLVFAVLRNEPGLAGVPGVAAAIMAIELVVGGCLVGYWREKHSLRGIVLLPVLLLAGYAFCPEPIVALVVGGLCTGGGLAALPRYGGTWHRLLFAGGFAAGASLVAFGVGGVGLLPILFPAVFAVAVWCAPVRWYVRLLLIALLPTAVWSYLNRLPEFSPRLPQPQVSIAPALPASLIAETSGEPSRILFISGRSSPLPGVWGALPYVGRVDCVTPFAPSDFGPAFSKFRFHTGLPGRVLKKLDCDYDVVFLAELPPGSLPARHGFCRLAWEKLSPGRGVLILPAADRDLLPPGVHIVPLPGSGGGYLAASESPTLTADPGVLDRRLLERQEALGKEAVFMPLGIFSALYFEEQPSSELVRSVRGTVPVEPEGFRLMAFVLLAGYSLLRLYFGRLGRVAGGLALAENAAGLLLILLAAGHVLAECELETGLPSLLVWGVLGVSFFGFTLRPGAERWFGWVALLSPLAWLFAFPSPDCMPGILLIALLIALATGMTGRRIVLETGFPRSWVVAFSGFGLAAGGVLFATLTLLLPAPFWPAVVMAIFLRLWRQLRF